MKPVPNTKIKTVLQLFEHLPDEERIIVDVLRQIVLEHLPPGAVEKIAYNVPLFRCKRAICLIWPASIPRGGIKKGVLLGFWYGNRMNDADGYLTKGTNKQVYYKIYQSADEIEEAPLVKILKEAVRIDGLNK